MKLITTALITVALLSACGGSSKDKKATTTPVTPPVVTVPTPVEAHHIQPDKVAEYVENFQQQHVRLSFEYDGQQYDFHFEETDKENKQLITIFEKGLLLIGFDEEKNEPLAKLTILEGDTTDLENFTPTRKLNGVDLTINESGDDAIYQGSVVDEMNNNKYNVRLVINESLLSAGMSRIIVDGNKASIFGSLGTSTYGQMKSAIDNNNLDTLVIENVSGSVNDAINLHTARLVRNAGLTTLMPKGGEAYSGGVDLFAAGKVRVYEDGGKLGVHSWCCENGKDAGQLSKADPAHNVQLTYFREMMGVDKGPEFYFFTIDAAPADGIHIMTKAEIDKYQLTTP